MVAAFLPACVGVWGGPELAVRGLGAGAFGAIGTYLAGHNSRLRAVAMTLAGAIAGLALGRFI